MLLTAPVRECSDININVCEDSREVAAFTSPAGETRDGSGGGQVTWGGRRSGQSASRCGRGSGGEAAKAAVAKRRAERNIVVGVKRVW